MNVAAMGRRALAEGLVPGLMLTGGTSLLVGLMLVMVSRSSYLLVGGALLVLVLMGIGLTLSWSLSRLALVFLGLGMAVGTRLEIGGISFDVVELVLIAALLTLIALNPMQLLQPLRGYEVALIGFLMVRLISTGFAADSRHAFSDLREWMEGVGALLVLTRVLANNSYIVTIRRALITGGILSAIFALGQAFLGWPAPFISETGQLKTFIDFSRQATYKVQPVVALQSHPNTFAIYMAVSIILLIFWSGREEDGLRRATRWFLVTVCLAAIVTTYAKTTFVALGLTLAVMPFYRYWGFSMRRAISLLGLGLFGIFLALRSVEAEGYEFALSSLYVRERLWMDSIQIIFSNLTGFLVGNQLDELSRSSVWGQPHNTALFLLLECGFLCTILAAIGGWALGRRMIARKSIIPQGGDGDLLFPRLGAALILYVGWTGMFESIGFPVHDRVFLGIVIGVLLAGRAFAVSSLESVPGAKGAL